jgi:hypothetical protein
MMTIQMDLDNRTMGSILLIPLTEAWLADHTCRRLLENVLNTRPYEADLLSNAESVKMFCLKQQGIVNGPGKKSRVDKEMANATACLDYNVSFVVDSFSTHSFYFEICSLPRQATVRPVVNPFDIIIM